MICIYGRVSVLRFWLVSMRCSSILSVSPRVVLRMVLNNVVSIVLFLIVRCSWCCVMSTVCSNLISRVCSNIDSVRVLMMSSVVITIDSLSRVYRMFSSWLIWLRLVFLNFFLFCIEMMSCGLIRLVSFVRIVVRLVFGVILMKVVYDIWLVMGIECSYSVWGISIGVSIVWVLV